MSRFKKTTRAPVFTDADLHAMPLDVLGLHAKETEQFARALASEAARAAQVFRRRKRALRANA